MNAGILGDLRRFGRDILIGLGLFAAIAVLILDGQIPAALPQVSSVLSIDANAADYTLPPYGPELVAKSASAAESNAFRFTGGWTAISLMAGMFALLYAFNLALFRRYYAHQHQARRNRFPPR
ncbi:MAG: hypothetical protein K0U74_04765 [Alphaproteobacteria bacterium]|nr:hypothetical protein [Alphaproteobacteria bacterium]